MLRGHQRRSDGRLLVGPEDFDDAGVVRLGEAEGLPAGVELALVQTADFFPPVVDDPGLYGEIAAANALSDVYAMGGRPVSALALASFPEEFPAEWIEAILAGGARKLEESGAVLAGGHTVQGEVQFGYAVTGVVELAHLTANRGAQAGDRLYLTKPLGMGTLTTAAKRKRIDFATLEPAARQMATLNRAAAEAMLAAGARAATDVTGYGLVGHGCNIARGSKVTLSIRAHAVPLFPGALELSRKGNNSGGAARGRAALGAEVRIAGGLEEALVSLLFDAETSGGLLIAIAPARAQRLEAELAERGVLVAPVGEVRARGTWSIELEA